MTYVSLQRSRHSHDIIKEKGEFVINLVNQELVRACDYCGVRSGRDVDKWADMRLTRAEADIVSAPLIAESPVNLECKVKDVLEYPSHDVFVSEIVSVHVDERLMDKSGKVRFEDAELIVYNHGSYMPVAEKSARHLRIFGDEAENTEKESCRKKKCKPHEREAERK